MDDEYLTPGFDYSYSTPFKKAFNHDQSEDDSFTTARSKATSGDYVDDDLDFLQNNLQNLALSDNQSSKYNRQKFQSNISPSQFKSNSSGDERHFLENLNMGVAESKENNEDNNQDDGQPQIQLPSFLNFGDSTVLSPKKVVPRKSEAASPPQQLNHHQQQQLQTPPLPQQYHLHQQQQISPSQQQRYYHQEQQQKQQISPSQQRYYHQEQQQQISPSQQRHYQPQQQFPPALPNNNNIVNNNNHHVPTPRVNVSANNLDLESEYSIKKEVQVEEPEKLEIDTLIKELKVEDKDVEEEPVKEEKLVKEKPIVPEPEPIQPIADVPNPMIIQLQDELAQEEEKFLNDLKEQDRILEEKQQELQAIEGKLKAATAKGEKDKETHSKLIKKQEAKMTQYAVEVERLKEEFSKKDSEKRCVINEREQAFSDLRNVENAYNDLLGKYVRSKELAFNYQKNQESLAVRDDGIWQKVESREKKINLLKAQVQENLETMHHEYEAKLREKRVDSENMRVRLKKMEMRVATLENDLEQKSQENAQLHKLCDEIINSRN